MSVSGPSCVDIYRELYASVGDDGFGLTGITESLKSV